MRCLATLSHESGDMLYMRCRVTAARQPLSAWTSCRSWPSVCTTTTMRRSDDRPATYSLATCLTSERRKHSPNTPPPNAVAQPSRRRSGARRRGGEASAYRAIGVGACVDGPSEDAAAIAIDDRAEVALAVLAAPHRRGTGSARHFGESAVRSVLRNDAACRGTRGATDSKTSTRSPTDR